MYTFLTSLLLGAVTDSMDYPSDYTRASVERGENELYSCFNVWKRLKLDLTIYCYNVLPVFIFLDDFATNLATEIPGTLPPLQSIFKLIISVTPTSSFPHSKSKLIDKPTPWQVCASSTECWRAVSKVILSLCDKNTWSHGEQWRRGKRFAIGPFLQPLVNFPCCARRCSRWTDSSLSVLWMTETIGSC